MSSEQPNPDQDTGQDTGFSQAEQYKQLSEKPKASRWKKWTAIGTVVATGLGIGVSEAAHHEKPNSGGITAPENPGRTPEVSSPPIEREAVSPAELNEIISANPSYETLKQHQLEVIGRETLDSGREIISVSLDGAEAPVSTEEMTDDIRYFEQQAVLGGEYQTQLLVGQRNETYHVEPNRHGKSFVIFASPEQDLAEVATASDLMPDNGKFPNAQTFSPGDPNLPSVSFIKNMPGSRGSESAHVNEGRYLASVEACQTALHVTGAQDVEPVLQEIHCNSQGAAMVAIRSGLNYDSYESFILHEPGLGSGGEQYGAQYTLLSAEQYQKMSESVESVDN